MSRHYGRTAKMWTDEKIEEIARLREDTDLTWKQIGARFGLTGKAAQKKVGERCADISFRGDDAGMPKALVKTFTWDFSQDNVACSN